MALGLEGLLLDRGCPRWSGSILVLVASAAAGSISMALFTGWNTRSGATGALFALTTVTMLLIIERLWAGTPHLSRMPATLLAVVGAILLGLVTLAMTPI